MLPLTLMELLAWVKLIVWIKELRVCPPNLCASQLNVEKGIGTQAAKALD